MVAVVGEPNVGKSSTMNMLLGAHRVSWEGDLGTGWRLMGAVPCACKCAAGRTQGELWEGDLGTG